MLHRPVGLVTTPVGMPAVAGMARKFVVLEVDVLLIPQLTFPLVDEVIAVEIMVPHVIALVPHEIVPLEVKAEQVMDANVADSVDTIGTWG